MQQLPKSLQDKLENRSKNGLLRELPTSSSLIDFASNDYLGLSKNKAVFTAASELLVSANTIANGATGSRLISGNHTLYTEAEDYIAQFHAAKSALLFNSGYDANVGFFSCVPQKSDVVLYDELIHASIRDGIRLSNASAYKFEHNNVTALKLLLERHTNKAAEVYIATESVFSMDGDTPDLIAIAKLAKNYNCKLVIDEAHALGVFGTKGEGLVQQLGIAGAVFARIVTFGKGLGCHGAAILGAKELRSYLVNFARSFIYTTGLPPHSVATILCAYKQMESDNNNWEQLRANINHFITTAKTLGLHQFIVSKSAIHCAVIPTNIKVKSIAQHLQKEGYNVKPIMSPTVAEGSERLRFCLRSTVTFTEIEGVLHCLKAAL
ncbi:aminotransferase class I/II-fold pyridoxal phosphate-dependent enzyme [Flavobacterium litorale]|uniref:8-amino-7-oxononanoate synthase n=1 Tax=Flavobacterium litorale TaxID=2856519 RepID=A0ABX8VEC5_9FLAO|nr:8-amino-7-oxononanoate synthase [Flavobacterium litorale]QYJ69175.1 8-amino-7-oxononanoate synthase [Flavobacterium litorale]